MKDKTKKVGGGAKHRKLIAILQIACLIIPLLSGVSALAAQSWDFSYTGVVQSFTAPYTGKYYLQTWGASGGGANSDKTGWGGYNTGYYNLTKGQTIYIVVGGAGSQSANGASGGYNGGGSSSNSAGSGGGATSITLTNRGVLKNFSSHRDEVIMVAGGGGGQPGDHTYMMYEYSIVPGTTYAPKDGGAIGSAEGLNGQGGGLSSTGSQFIENSVEASKRWILDAYATGGSPTAGYAFGQGQSASTAFNYGYSGAGGGGWYGGKTTPSTVYSRIGGGGSGYLGDCYDTTNSNGQNRGNGKAKITYSGTVNVVLTIRTNNGGTWKGKTGTITENHSAGDVVSIPNPVGYDGYTFEGWEVEFGSYSGGTSYTFGFQNLTLRAKWRAPFTLVSEQQGNSQLYNLTYTDADSANKQYKVWQSTDGRNWYPAALAENGGSSPSYLYQYTGGVQEFTAPFSAYWKLETFGAGGSYGQGGGGSAGGYATGAVYLNKGEKVYIAVGGKGEPTARPGIHDNSYVIHPGGWNGGGDAQRGGSGGAGGATSITTTNRGELKNFESHKNEVLLIAGGGAGGGAWDYTSEGLRDKIGRGGGLTGEEGADSREASNTRGTGGTQTSAGRNGSFGQGGSGPNSGGGGWYGGGSATGSHATGGGGSSYYNTSKLVNYSTTTGAGALRNNDGYAKINLFDVIQSSTYLNGVYLYDKAAPNRPSNGIVIDRTVSNTKVQWNKPSDNGTTYYHKVDAYNLGNISTVIKTSNTTTDVVKTGVVGYYYYVDGSSSGTVNKNHSYTTSNQLNLGAITTNRYVHVAAVDGAGNLGGTYTFLVEAYIDVTCIDTVPSSGKTLGTQAATKKYAPGATAKGSDWGSDTTPNKYYTGYIYSNCTSIAVSASQYVVYRYFVPITYTVRLHKNTPTDATHDVVSKLDSTWSNKGTYYEKVFTYDDTKLPTVNSSYTLTGWHSNTNWYSNAGNNGQASGTQYSGGKNNLTTSHGSIINLYPYWNKNTYYIKYDGNNTTYNIYGDRTTTSYSGNTNQTTHKYDSSVTLAQNGFNKKGYIFKEWNTKSDGTGSSYSPGQVLNKPNFTTTNRGTFTLYAIWEPIRYSIQFHSNDTSTLDYNTTDSYYQSVTGSDGKDTTNIRYDQPITLDNTKFNRNKDIALSNGSIIKDGYDFIGWGTSSSQKSSSFVDKWSGVNFNGVSTNGTTINIYALWERPLAIRFNLQGGKYKDREYPNGIIINAKVYNDRYDFNFNILDGLAGQSGNSTAQIGSIHAYGNYDSDGVNSLYTLRDSTGSLVRFVGWSSTSSIQDLMRDYIVYNPSRLSTMNTLDTNDNTYKRVKDVYAVYEEVLRAEISVGRTLGELEYENGDNHILKAGNITASNSSTGVVLRTIIKPGEQGNYDIRTVGSNSNTTTQIIFDSAVTDIYDNEDEFSTWHDNLNPIADHPLNSDQKHGLNRLYTGEINHIRNKWYTPNYFGTDKSYDTSKDKTQYTIGMIINQESIFYDWVYGTDETIKATVIIDVTNKDISGGGSGEDGDNVDTTLDELRTRLKIRVLN